MGMVAIIVLMAVTTTCWNFPTSAWTRCLRSLSVPSAIRNHRSSSFHPTAADSADAIVPWTTDAAAVVVMPTSSPTKFVPFPFSYRQEITVSIDSLTNRGWGVGRVALPHDDDDTASPSPRKPWVVMVPGVIPGETVTVRVFRNFDSYSEADVVSIIEPSSDRVTPRCAFAATCGGCQYQHMNIDLQRRWKTNHVREALAMYGLKEDTPVQDCWGTEHIYEYRSKLTPHYQAPFSSSKRRHSSQRLLQPQSIGFQQQTSRHIVDISSCCIATPAINEAYQQRRHEMLTNPPTSNRGATMLFRQANYADSNVVVTNHKESMTTTVNGLNFTYLAGNFFQNNYHVLPEMVRLVVDASQGMTHLIDCYCGSGLFAVAAAAAGIENVVGIEINDKAVQEATKNAIANGVNATFHAASAEAIFEHIVGVPTDSTVVVLDPPRKGCSGTFLQQLLQFGPARIVYMSCDPVTQARDAALLSGRYEIQSVQPFDLFPQTRHIECLMVLDKKKKDTSP